MIEIFQSIANNLEAWLLGLGLSSATIYVIYRIIKGIVYVCFQKKKKQLKHKADIQAVAEATAVIVIEKLKPMFEDIDKSLTSIKAKLEIIDETVKTNENETITQLAIDTKAYQSVVLAQDSDLLLSFETLRADLINKSQRLKQITAETCEDVSTIANNVADAVVENEEKILQTTEDVKDAVKKVKNTAKKVKERVVTYD